MSSSRTCREQPPKYSAQRSFLGFGERSCHMHSKEKRWRTFQMNQQLSLKWKFSSQTTVWHVCSDQWHQTSSSGSSISLSCGWVQDCCQSIRVNRNFSSVCNLLHVSEWWRAWGFSAKAENICVQFALPHEALLKYSHGCSVLTC